VAIGALVLTANFKGAARELKQFKRLPVPGQKVLSLAAGKHVIYLESAQGEPAGGLVNVRVADAASGQALALAPYATSFTYDSGGRHGRAVQTFTTPRSGAYRVMAAGPQGTGLSVTVGPPLGGKLVDRIFGVFSGFGLLFGGPLLGGVIVLVTALLRHRSGQREQPAGGSPAVAASAQAQPGWYADPHGQARLRWWDGQRWTDHTA
jgi:hypothetical protein